MTIRKSVAPAVVLAAVLLNGCGGGGAGYGREYEWVATHPGAPSPVKKAVLSKRLMAGMSEGATVASWGEPDRKVDLGGGDSRWVYRKRQIRNAKRIVIEYTLIFRRGVLVRVLK